MYTRNVIAALLGHKLINDGFLQISDEPEQQVGVKFTNDATKLVFDEIVKAHDYDGVVAEREAVMVGLRRAVRRWYHEMLKTNLPEEILDYYMKCLKPIIPDVLEAVSKATSSSNEQKI